MSAAFPSIPSLWIHAPSASRPPNLGVPLNDPPPPPPPRVFSQWKQEAIQAAPMFSRLFGSSGSSKAEQSSAAEAASAGSRGIPDSRTAAASLPEDPSEILGQAQELLGKLRNNGDQEQSFALLNTATRLGRALLSTLAPFSMPRLFVHSRTKLHTCACVRACAVQRLEVSLVTMEDPTMKLIWRE